MSYKSSFCALESVSERSKVVVDFVSLTGEGELQDEACGPLQREGGGRHHLGVCHQEERHCIWYEKSVEGVDYGIYCSINNTHSKA